MRWPALLLGLVVVPLCLRLLVGLPYEIYLDRDLQLHGLPVTATAVSERQVWFKDRRQHRMVTFRYDVHGRTYEREFGDDQLRIGDTLRLRYAPSGPGHSYPATAMLGEWDEGLGQRLTISWMLGAIFLSVWLTVLLRAGR